MTKLKKQLADLALDYFNNYLSIEKFAEHNELTVNQASELIELGKELHEERVTYFKTIEN
jgi:hypothetical protein